MHWQQQQQEQYCSAEMNLFSMMETIAKEEGVGHLWSGTWASILLVSNPVIQFFLYEQIKSALLRRRQDQRRLRRLSSSAVPPSLDTLSPMDAFVVGAVAKTIATIATYPVQLAQTVLRLQEKRSPSGSTADGKEYDEEVQDNSVDGDKDTLRCLVRIYQEDGVAGIYQGMNAKLLQTVLTASFMFIGYEKILEFAALITK
jgi:adenine nucleotide transporter 17